MLLEADFPLYLEEFQKDGANVICEIKRGPNEKFWNGSSRSWKRRLTHYFIEMKRSGTEMEKPSSKFIPFAERADVLSRLYENLGHAPAPEVARTAK